LNADEREKELANFIMTAQNPYNKTREKKE